MDKTTLHKIFNKAFDDSNWFEVLKVVFGAKLGLLAQAKPIMLANNDKASAAFELGSFTTTDDRIIGLYKIEVRPEVWLERNKVGLRKLLRNVYEYDVDGAIIVFVQEEKWRLSFVSEIKVLNDEGEIVEQATEPKRYTYLLGEGEKVRTPSDRLSKISGKSLALQDILNAFSVEALNEEFYGIIQAFFYKLVGGKIGKGKKLTDYGRGILQLPSVPKENRQLYQEFAVRLIGRTVFCWFLKMKKSNEEAPLLPESLLSSKAVKKNTDYYHFILERLFFQTLNTPVKQRIDNLPDGAEQIPFLNGGLFEPGIQDFYKESKITGLNENLNTLKIDDQWFVNFFEELEKYNFTIDENSVTDVEVSVDPEMLGRIFENLLAEIDPDSGETARKATGSFYTPREIVDYMVTESLVQYIFNKTKLPKDKLRPIFKMMDNLEPDFSRKETEIILDALDKVKILDPACGSGAFPMGVLQKVVQALQKLDPEAEWWKKRQVSRISNGIVRKQLKEKLEASGIEYARKIGVIQNSLYGVDIQPVAAEISKLRCFLSLVVDENIDDTKPNRGIEPLPNLEFKFVTADTLIKLPEEDGQRGLFDNWEEMQVLEELRNEYIQSFGKQKQRIKEQFLKVQYKMFKDQLTLFSDKTSRAYQLSTWNPFSHEKSNWFDPKWMFGVEKFDIVIGNPPYVSAVSMARSENKKKIFKTLYPEATGAYDLYILFLLKGLELGSSSYSWIIPNRFLIADYSKETKSKLEYYGLKESIDVSSFGVFKTASVYPIIINGSISEKKESSNFKEYLLESIKDLSFRRFKIPQKLKDFPTFKEQGIKIGSGATGFEAKKIAKMLRRVKSPNSIPFTVSGCIDRYAISNRNVRYMGEKYDEAFIENSDSLATSKWNFWYAPKIIIAGMTKVIEAVYVDTPMALGVGVYAIYNWEKNDPYALTTILNSKYLSYYLNVKFKDKHLAGGYLAINKSTLEELPLVEVNKSQGFRTLYFYLKKLLNNKFDEVNQFVPNSHIAQLFEEVIDAMVMELYFKEDFELAGIGFIKYVGRDFESIEGKPEHEQITIIHRAYQKLREKDNEIRNNLKLMDIKLADIIMPIKVAK